MDTTIGQRLARARRRAGLSQARLAAEVGCSSSYVSKVERGELALNDLTLARRLADAVMVPPGMLLGLDDERPVAGYDAHPPRLRDEEMLDGVDRRTWLTSAGRLAGGLAGWTLLGQFDPDERDVLMAALADPDRHVGERVVGLLERADARAQRRTVPLPIDQRLAHAHEHLAVVRRLRPAARSDSHQQRLAVVEVQAARLLGRLVGDWRGDPAGAGRLFGLALAAAHDTGPQAATLRAYTLGGLGYLHSELGDPRVAVGAVTQALQVAADSPVRTLPSWLHATAGLAFARVGDRRACHDAVAAAHALYVTPGDDDPVWLRGFLTPGLLVENRATSELWLGGTDAALVVLEEAERLLLARPGRIQQYAVLLVHRAEALARQGHINAGCQAALDALGIAMPIGYALVINKVRALWQGRWARHHRLPPVREVGELLRLAQPTS